MAHPRTTIASTLLSGVLLVSLAAPSGAITDGTPDTANIYANVGRLEYKFEGMWFGGCSGTLIAPDLVLTAAHCIGFPGQEPVPPADLRINFNPAVAQPADPGDPLAYGAAAIAVHPEFGSAALRGGKVVLSSPWEDIALVWLTEEVAGISPADVAPAAYLDSLNLKVETFISVGFGLNGFTSANAIVEPQYRSYREVRALGHDAFPERFLKVSAANCFGDSGGPLFHGTTVVAMTIWTNSARCEGPGLDYRVDSAIAQQFLAANL